MASGVLSAALSVTLKFLPEGPMRNLSAVRNANRWSISSRQHDKRAVGTKRAAGLTGGGGAIKANMKREDGDGKGVKCKVVESDERRATPTGNPTLLALT